MLRPFSLAVLAALALGCWLGGAPALASSKSAHHAPRCRSAHGKHARAVSVHAGRRPSRSRRHARCRRFASHARQHRLSGYAVYPPSPSAPAQAVATPSGACADGNLKPTPEDLDRIRAATFCLVNRERTVRGESALRIDAHLAQAAQSHTESMAGGNYFDHTEPSGNTPLDRMRSAGYIYSSRLGYDVGENIAWGTGTLSTPSAIVAAWMASPGHRANILDPRYRDTAIGVSAHPPRSFAHEQPGGLYTQDFGRILTA